MQIHKKIVYDDTGKPCEVLIPYDEYIAIEKQLSDTEDEEFYNFSMQNLGDAYSEDEPEYSEDDIIEYNKDYKE